MKLPATFIIIVFIIGSAYGQNAGLETKTIEDMMEHIDELLNEVDQANDSKKYNDPSKTLLLPTSDDLDRPFRYENELMSENLQPSIEDPISFNNVLLTPAPTSSSKTIFASTIIVLPSSSNFF